MSREAVDYTNRGIVNAQDGDFDGALADFTKAIELDFVSGIAKFQNGDLDGAIDDIVRAIRLRAILKKLITRLEQEVRDLLRNLNEEVYDDEER